MTSIGSYNSLSSMLGMTSNKLDRGRNGSLESDEFGSFNDILKPRVPVEDDSLAATDYGTSVEPDTDGGGREAQMQDAPVMTPSVLTDQTLSAIWQYLSNRSEASAQTGPSAMDDDDSADL